MRFPFQSSRWPIGLDLSNHNFRAVALGPKNLMRNKGSVKLLTFSSVSIPDGVFDEGELKDEDTALEKLKLLVQEMRKKIQVKEVIASLPVSKTFITVIDLPTDELTNEKVQAAAAQHIPLPLDQMILDWHVVSPEKFLIDFKTKKKISVLVGAAEKSTVEKYIRLLEAAGLSPLALEPECVPLIRSLFTEEELENGPWATIYLGAHNSFLTFFHEGAIYLTTTLPISGSQMTKMIQNALNISYEEAEQKKIICGLDPELCNEELLQKTLQTIIDDLVRKINEALAFIRSSIKVKTRPRKILLAGGGSQLLKIENILSRKLRIKVRSGNPWLNLKISPPEQALLKDPLVWGTAMGLALRPAQLTLIDELSTLKPKMPKNSSGNKNKSFFSFLKR